MKELSVHQQTRALLHKNLLKKWRMKRESLLEWSIPIIIGLYMGLLSYFKENDRVPEVPPQNLGSIDEFNGSYIMVVYTPISNITQQIMNKTTFAPTMKGTKLIGVPSKKELDEVFLENMPHAIGVIFNDTFSYKLKIHQMYGNPYLKEDLSGGFLIYNPTVTVFMFLKRRNGKDWVDKRYLSFPGREQTNILLPHLYSF